VPRSLVLSQRITQEDETCTRNRPHRPPPRPSLRNSRRLLDWRSRRTSRPAPSQRTTARRWRARRGCRSRRSSRRAASHLTTARRWCRHPALRPASRWRRTSRRGIHPVLT